MFFLFQMTISLKNLCVSEKVREREKVEELKRQSKGKGRRFFYSKRGKIQKNANKLFGCIYR